MVATGVEAVVVEVVVELGPVELVVVEPALEAVVDAGVLVEAGVLAAGLDVVAGTGSPVCGSTGVGVLEPWYCETASPTHGDPNMEFAIQRPRTCAVGACRCARSGSLVADAPAPAVAVVAAVAAPSAAAPPVAAVAAVAAVEASAEAAVVAAVVAAVADWLASETSCWNCVPSPRSARPVAGAVIAPQAAASGTPSPSAL